MKVFISISGRDILYHTTSLNNLYQILKTDKFKLSFVGGTKSDRDANFEKLFYMSFSRSRIGRYNRSWGPTNCVLVIDGRKLSQRYRVEPVDYWGPSFRKVDPQSTEMEERLVTDEQFIPNAKSYIKEVHCLYKKENEEKAPYITLFKKALGKKLFVYDNEKDAVLLNKRKAIEVTGHGEFSPLYGRLEPDPKYIKPYIELFEKDDIDDLSERAKKIVYNLHSLSWQRSLEADLHNAKKNPIMSDFARLMRKHKLRDTKEIQDYVWEKFRNR